MDQYGSPEAPRNSAARALPHIALYRAAHLPQDPDEAIVADLITDLLHYAEVHLSDEGGALAVLNRVHADFDGETPDETPAAVPPPPCPSGHRPDDLPEPGDRCKDCGWWLSWEGPGLYDWIAVAPPDPERN